MPRGVAYRVFFSKKAGRWSYGQEVVYGKKELDRVLKRKRPRAIHHEVALLHTCDVCGKRGPWTKRWSPIPKAYRDGKSVWPSGRKRLNACSDACREKHVPGWNPDRWMQDDNEPLGMAPQELKEARWKAFYAEQERKRDLVAHRSVPMPNDTKGDGWCRWCGKPVQKPRRTWHAECLREYNLHTSADVQFRFLVKRDGDLCANGNCGKLGHEVDHRTPLWKIRDLPECERIQYYGPDNIWLLCSKCHRDKTKREAGERAALARETGDC